MPGSGIRLDLQLRKCWMLADFLAFLVVTGLTPGQVNVDIILAFLEYLVDNSLSVANICKYLAGLKTMFIIQNLPTHPFRDEKSKCLSNL